MLITPRSWVQAPYWPVVWNRWNTFPQKLLSIIQNVRNIAHLVKHPAYYWLLNAALCLFSHCYCQYPTQLVNNKKLAWSTKGLDALRVGIKNDHHTLRFVLVLVNSWCCVLSLCVLHMQNFRFNLRNYTVDLCANWVTFNHEGTRTLNLLIRSQTPCPLGHVVLLLSPEV